MGCRGYSRRCRLLPGCDRYHDGRGYAPNGAWEGVAAIGGPFTLVDDNGAHVTEKTLAGKPYVMYFGYTYCPEVCPTTLLDLSRWIKQLGPDANKLSYVFVTVDPERDTPKLLHAYRSSFDRGIRGFTGTSEQVAKNAKEYRVYYKKIPTSAGSYVMDHSSIIYLIGSDGRFVSTITYQERDDSALAKLRNLILAPSQTRSGPLHTSNALALRIVDNVDAMDVSRVNRGIDKSRPLPKPDQLSAFWK